MTTTNPPAERSARVAALLEKIRSQPRPRLSFALDATASRQPTWDLACQLQSEMFAEVGRLGGLDVQLVYYRGEECRASRWTSDAYELAQAMRRIMCIAGQTQIGRVLAHIRKEHAIAPVAAAVFVGDAVEEIPSQLIDAAGGLGVPLFMLQEDDTVEVSALFGALARLTHGAHLQFRPGAARELAELLRAIAAFATGGIRALADQNSEGARKLLGQMRSKP